jgi:hypothetical protein
MQNIKTKKKTNAGTKILASTHQKTKNFKNTKPTPSNAKATFSKVFFEPRKQSKVVNQLRHEEKSQPVEEPTTKKPHSVDSNNSAVPAPITSSLP